MHIIMRVLTILNKKETMGRILYNAIKCKHCGDICVSKHGHDMAMCSCKKVGADGGQNYLRRIGLPEDMEELYIADDGKHETRRNYLRWGVNYDKDMNRLPETEWRLIKDLNTDHIQAILDGNYASGNTYYEDVFKEELKFREKNK